MDPNTALDQYTELPTATLYDVFSETATQLTGRYTRLSDTAPTAEEREAWWAKVMALRDLKRQVPPEDRATLLARIRSWNQELDDLGAGHGRPE